MQGGSQVYTSLDFNIKVLLYGGLNIEDITFSAEFLEGVSSVSYNFTTDCYKALLYAMWESLISYYLREKEKHHFTVKWQSWSLDQALQSTLTDTYNCLK